jgi:hypothetical protein
MADCINWLRSWSQLDEQELRQLGRENPLRLLGLDDPAMKEQSHTG